MTPPLCWVLVNAQTAKVLGGTSVYVREEAAQAMAQAMTNRWRTVAAIPVSPYVEEPDDA